MDKSKLRKIFREKRNSLSPDEIKTKSQLITENFITNLLPKISNFSDKKIAFYLPVNNEVDTKYLIEYFSEKGNILALPKIPEHGRNLIFKEYKKEENLEKNILFSQIPEPKSDANNIDPDLIFVPLLAFDNHCNRLGMGKGFYDFTINQIRKTSRNALFIGLGYDFQLHKKIPNDINDQTLDFIASEKKIFHFK